MSRLEIILSSILLISVIFNIGVFAYARAAIVRLLWVADELGDLKQIVSNFSVHLQTIYDTEMFYGDQTLQALVEHARSFDEQLDTFEYIYTLTDEEEENPPDDDTDTAREET
jgi:hypothetical protein|tara:strand:+ start:674 stop:1012 length:339 start_codon:yes stop_codon:yes gene_type:complete